MTSGEILKKKLGINNFNNAYIQRVINSAYPVYIITLDSMHPDNYISWARLKRSMSAVIVSAATKNGEPEVDDFRLTPPIELNDFDGNISSRSIIVRRDMVGDYFIRKNLYETACFYKSL